MSENTEIAHLRVALLSGGRSGEREISLASGNCVEKALCSCGAQVVRLDPLEKSDLQRLVSEEFDVAFLCMHGKYGEDGTLQGMLELLGIPYIGSGVWASATAMDKVRTKECYDRASIPTPKSRALVQGEPYDVDELIAELGSRVVVKDPFEGSTLGLYIVEGAEAIDKALHDVWKNCPEALVETYVVGREFTVVVLGGADIEALPVIEIIPRNEFYDFDAKYSAGGSVHVCPAEISEESTQGMQSAALEAHRVLGCYGISRTDFLLAEEGSFWALETNTLPGMTETSLVPDAARAIGVSYADLCVRLINLALQKNNKSK